ncbi:MAG TPA: hypothetical protein VFZ66_26660 [Herpetosiphonaceae bacterium]
MKRPDRIREYRQSAQIHWIASFIRDVAADVLRNLYVRRVPAREVSGEVARCAPTVTRHDMVGALKSRITVDYIHGVKTRGWTLFSGRLWQRNDYERIIRNETALNRIRQDIADHPARWKG